MDLNQEENQLVPMDRLTERERTALKAYEEKEGYRLATSLQAQLFSLFLNGSSCLEIAKLNKLPHGAVIQARLEGDWDRLRDEHMARLFDTVAGRVRQVQVEAVDFIATVLSATHKKQREAIQRFIQTGDATHLKNTMVPDNVRNYKDLSKLLLEMTGQNNTTKLVGQIEHTGKVENTVSVESIVGPEHAEALRELLLKSQKNGNDS